MLISAHEKQLCVHLVLRGHDPVGYRTNQGKGEAGFMCTRCDVYWPTYWTGWTLTIVCKP